MRTSWIAIAFLLAALPLGADAKRQPCPDGRYVVEEEWLNGALDMPAPDVVDVTGRMVSVQSGCPAAKARIRATGIGTKVRVKWKSCPAVGGKAVLSGVIMEECTLLQGIFTARRAGILRQYRARRSRCGDQVWDAGAGEQCDGNGGLCGDQCVACMCPGGTTTTIIGGPGDTTSTTTTPSSGSSTSTSTMPGLPTTSTTTTTLMGADLRPHAWMSPGSAPKNTNIAIEFIVRNYGTATASAPWYDYVLISTDLAVGNDTAIAVVQRASNLAASAQYTVLTQATVPSTPGTYYLFLHTDGSNAVAETNEPNNVGGFVQLTVTP